MVLKAAMRQLEVLDPLLFRLFERGELDPWNIDLEKLCKLYEAEIKKRGDLRVSGNAIISAASILKLKLETLLKRKEEVEEKEKEESFEDLEVEVIPLRAPRTAITIFDLLEALEDVFKKSKKSRKKTFQLEVEAVDLSKIMEKILAAVNKPLKITALGSHALMAFLHLATEEKISVEQVEWNGPFMVRKSG